ncbi:glucose 1-dehydrogenase [Microbacterium sp. DT81.1]|uniref:glucose 1-dehydrogenase n=1 Tax=Microbacterium sp. DT81.1 TaxID=3393413 RepID=UPI003CF0B43A
MTDTSAHRFDDKVVFLTGAANGIGRATAIAFGREGAKLALVDIDGASNAETAKLVEEAGGAAIALRADVTVEADVIAAIDAAVEHYGRIDIAFNNVGRDQKVAPLHDTDEHEWRRTIDLNVTSMFFCMRNQIPRMLAQGGGTIVNTASGAGLIGIKGTAVYATAKHAVVGLTRSAALDYADRNIRINAVAPGIVETDMMRRVSGGTEQGRADMVAEEPIGRLGQPEEIASAVLWLASDGASFAIGSTLVVDGGHTIR